MGVSATIMEQFSFQPTLNSRSLAIEQERMNRGEVGQDRGEYLFYKDHEIRYRQELARKRMMEEEMEGCTFSPQVNPAMGYASRISCVQHSQMWNERRDEWRNQAQERRLEEEMKECTFRPEIDITQRVAPSSSRPSTPGNNESTSKAKGFDEFVLRQEAARQARDEAKIVPHVAGNNWTRTATKPQPFTFNRTEKIRSLERPGKPTELSKRRPEMLTAPPAVPMEYDEDGEPIMDTMQYNQGDDRVEARLQRFLNKYTNRAEDDGEGGDEEDDETVGGRRGSELGYYKRMAEARRIRAEKEQALNQTTGRKWKAKPTVTKSFHFNDPSHARVSSLQKPVTPLRADWF